MSSPRKMWARMRKNKNGGSSSSPPDTLPNHNEDLAAQAASEASSSLSSTIIMNSEGFNSTPPSYNNEEEHLSPLSMSPNNTPKKDWELHYKSFLSSEHIGDDKSGGDQSSDGSHHFFNGMTVPDIRKQPSNQAQLARSLPPYVEPSRHRVKSDQGVSYRQSITSASKVRTHNSSMNGGADSDGSGRSYGSMSSDRSRNIKFKDSSPPKYLSRDVLSAHSSEGSAHGGKIFSVFQRKRKDKKAGTRTRPKSPQSSLDKSGSIKSRARSCGSLDAAMRNGEIVKQGDAPGSQILQGRLLQPNGTVTLMRPKSHRDNFMKRKDKRREKKLAFTEYHNSQRYAGDSTAPYLGEEKSVQRGSHFAKLKLERAQEEESKICDKRDLLASVSEDSDPSSTTLTPIRSTDHWVEGTRYLMAPAIIAACPNEVMSLFQEEDASNSCGNQLFERINMGSAEVAQIVSKGLLKEDYKWSSGKFVLQQNYLLEYAIEENVVARPRGFAFLQNASIRRHDKFVNTIIIDFYQNHPESSIRKSILLKLKTEPEREDWLSSLSKAARLRVEDLYEYNTSPSAQMLGEGRFASVFPGRRRREKISSQSNKQVGTEKKDNVQGILKKKPSFSSFSNLTMHLDEDEYECALKIIDKDKFWNRVKKDKERGDSIVREISVQAALQSGGDVYPGFLRVKSFFETLHKVVLELELLNGIDLFRYISSKQKMEQKVDEVEAARIMYDILSCLQTMKSNGIAHRDIKPANILIANKDDPYGVKVKLGDFGMATFVGEDNLVQGRCGTPGYVAPEIMAAKKSEGYKNNVDIFSAGVIMYILLCGYEPFYGESEKELIAENLKGKVDYPDDDWSTVSVEGRHLVQRMLERDYKKRILPSEALQHAWIKRRAGKTN